MIVSLNLSKGAMEMSKKGVIVKQLSSIQNFGNMDVLCTDKTGTLTENKIALIKHIDIEGNDDEKVFEYSYLNSYFETGLKSPLDDAILSYEKLDTAEYNKIDEIPFDFNRKRVSIVVEQQGQHIFTVKGAPEEILKVCSGYEFQGQKYDLDEESEARIQKQFNDLSSEGFRALGVAYKYVSGEKVQFTINDEDDLILLGFVAFLDPPKESVGETIRKLIEFGIDVKILTGDNELVTKKVCEEIKLPIKGIVLGSEVAGLSDEALARVVETANIFARVNPGQKNRIMHAMQLNGHVVGFLGDGINDSPSIKAADVGISVENAVDVAKESADLILLQKNLNVLYDGALEGRKTFSNTLKYIQMGVSSNFGNMFTVAGASIVLPFIPMLPTQILLNNLLYDLSQTTIPTDNVDLEQIQRPRKLDIAYIRRFMLIMGPTSSLFDVITFLFIIFVFQLVVIDPTTGLPAAMQPAFWTVWWVESICTQTLVIFVLRARKIPFYKSKPSRALVVSCFGIVAVAIAIPFIPPIAKLFNFGDIPNAVIPWFFVFLVGVTLAYLTLVEYVKRWFNRHYINLTEHVVIPHEHGKRDRGENPA
jgi:Mg2+-importing ATPase